MALDNVSFPSFDEGGVKGPLSLLFFYTTMLVMLAVAAVPRETDPFGVSLTLNDILRNM